MKNNTLKERYRKARKAYVERVRYYSKKYGIKSELIKIPKRIKEGSIRRLEKLYGKDKILKSSFPLGAPEIAQKVDEQKKREKDERII